MNDFAEMHSVANLRRAYRWLLSNPDARYKNLFRDSYAAFAIASAQNIAQLSKDLRDQRYQPTHASKIYLPKGSGLLRPITLLNVDDQIVYQACVNIIADRLKPRTLRRYRKTVFAHLYAGRRSPFFYMKWQDSYRLFASETRRMFATGFRYVANFDLTSFYDTIDHHVLGQFLSEIGIDLDLRQFLLDCLRVWTSATWANRANIIYHRHGIPQGPLSSGMLSEAVLTHIDSTGERGKAVRYLRYVDDIKLFARREVDIRRRLVALDICCKEIGLFPQSSKINIRPFVDPDREIKSVSRPPEPSIGPFGNKHRLVRRLLELSRGGKVTSDSSTRFKYLLPRVSPDHRLNERLLLVARNHPELAESIAAYFMRYSNLPKKAAEGIIRAVTSDELYHSWHADLLRATLDNMQEPERAFLANFCYRRLFGKRVGHWLPLQPSYKEALIAWVIRCQRITFAELEDLRRLEIDWWVRKSIFRQLTPDHFGAPGYRAFVNQSLRSDVEEARSAAAALIEREVKLDRPYGDINFAAKLSLRTVGLIRSVGRPQSMLHDVLQYVLRCQLPVYDWTRLLGPKHKQAEKIAVFVKQQFEVDIDACVVRLDSLCDLIYEAIFSKLAVGSTYGAYGGMLNAPNQTLKNAIPDTINGFKALHQLRLQSLTAHPRMQRTGRPTKRIKHRDFARIRKPIERAFHEIRRAIVP